MKKILLFLLFTTLLLAKNPIVYAALGDVIYNNAGNILQLKKINAFTDKTTLIDKYIEDMQRTKEKGFAIENGSKKYDKREYLKELRTLAKTNKMLIREVNISFKESIKKENSLLFSQIINSGLIDTKKNKEKILSYYFAHAEDVNSTGVIEDYLEADKRLKAKYAAQRKQYKTKKMREAERIKRIRENDRREQEKFETKLSQEVKQKKLEIRENQKKELFN